MYELKAEFSLMTGSGSTIFGIFPNTLSARNASASFNDDYFKYIEIPKSF
jgi:4-diphosphocytidyl-2C-methyl-D-erythritol kinase